MDADLQDPPHVILEMAAKWQEGYEVVYAVRQRREGETRFKTRPRPRFYSLLRRLAASSRQWMSVTSGSSTGRLSTPFCRMREHNRYVRGMFSWIGFRQAGGALRPGAAARGQQASTRCARCSSSLPMASWGSPPRR